MPKIMALARQPIIPGWEAEAPPNIEDRNDGTVQVNDAQGDGRGLWEGRYGNHRNDLLHYRKGEGIALALDAEDDQPENRPLNGCINCATAHCESTPGLDGGATLPPVMRFSFQQKTKSPAGKIQSGSKVAPQV